MAVVIADDLTGAAELAGVAWRYGLRAELQPAPGVLCRAKVTALDTDSRACRGEEAARRVEQAAASVAGQDWVYKKVDSVLRGPVVAEIEAALRALRLSRALLVPANPGLNRIIRDGRYFVNGKPLDATDFRNDPQYPRRSSEVLELLKPQGSKPVSLCRVGQPLPREGIAVGEAETREDLLAWAGKLDGTTLPAGGAEFFSAILETRGRQARATAPAAPAGTRTLFVCGSAAASANRFLVECGRFGLPVVLMPATLRQHASRADEQVREWAEEALGVLQHHSQVVVAIGPPQVCEPGASARLSEHLVATVKSILEHEPVEDILVEGGATAAALVYSMGWRRLRVLGELAPGVVRLEAGPGARTKLTMKPGSYAWPQTVRPRAERAQHAMVFGSGGGTPPRLAGGTPAPPGQCRDALETNERD